MPDIRPDKPVLPILTINLDWRAYFLKFCEEHGDPVPFEGRLLFPDGWTYSDRRYEGPEWPPPTDEAELRRITTWYWRLRKITVRAEAERILNMVKWIDENQYGRGAPLQHRVQPVDDNGQPFGPSVPADVDPTALRERLKFLDDDVAECEAKIKEIGDGSGCTGAHEERSA